MVESDFLPRGSNVALFARVAKRALVIVIFTVTGHARGRGVPELGFEVALLAWRVPVFSLKAVFGFRVVEALGIKRHELKLATLVLGVTGLASFRVGLAVEPSLLLSVYADFLVTGDAFGRE
jgi:hypothetical protein